MPKLLARGLSEREFHEQKNGGDVKLPPIEHEHKTETDDAQKPTSPNHVAERTGYLEFDADPDEVIGPFDFDQNVEGQGCVSGITAYFYNLGPYPICMITAGYLVTWLMLGSHALPGGVLWGTGLLWLVCTFLGARAGQIGLPPLVGMIAGGFILRNTNLLPSGTTWSATGALLKGIALTIIMLRAGFGLDLQKLKANAALMGLLSWIPAFSEACTIMALSIAIFSFDVKWGFLLGFVIADVSPAVTVPLLLDFQLQGYGVDKGIPTILLAGSGFNSVFAIIAYGIVMSFIFSGGAPIWFTVTIGLGQVIVGIIAGYIVGVGLEKIWEAHGSDPIRQLIMTFLGGAFLQFGGGPIGMSGGGTLAVVVVGIVVNDKLKSRSKPVQELLAAFWARYGQPFLFGLLGAAVDLGSLTPSVVLGGCGLVAGGLVLRVAATYLCTLTTDWNSKEKLFACITWCPKATVQAALSTVALDYVQLSENRKEFDDDGGPTDYDTAEDRAVVVLTVAVLSIILTAPLFAVCMKYAGENWLVKSDMKAEGEEDEDGPFDGNQPVTVELSVGVRKQAVASTLGDTTIDFGGGGDEESGGGRRRGFTLTQSTPTPAGVEAGVTVGRVRSLSAANGGTEGRVRSLSAAANRKRGMSKTSSPLATL